MNCGIYHIKNMVNGMIYIGQSTNLKERFRSQRSVLRNGRSWNKRLQNDVSTYGIESFEFKIIAYCLPSQLDLLEKLFIKEYKSNERDFGYNIEIGGNKDKVIMPETKEKLAQSCHNKRAIRDNKTGMIYPSVREACKKMEVAEATMWRRLAGRNGRKEIDVTYVG